MTAGAPTVGAEGSPRQPAVPREKLLRVLTLNFWGDNGPAEARLRYLTSALHDLDPDVVTLQEVREIPGRIPNQAAELGRALGWHHAFAPSTEWGGGSEGLAVVSRFPIAAHDFKVLPHSTEKEGRIVLSALVDGPAGPIWVHTTHLSFREHEGLKREEQVLAVDDEVTAHKNDQIQIVTGDFNAEPSSDEMRWMVGATTLAGRRVAYQDAWDRQHPGEAGHTWVRANPYTERLHWLKRDRRLDYLFVTPVRRDRRGTIHAARLVFDRPREMPAGECIFASDHFGVMADVQVGAQDPKAGS